MKAEIRGAGIFLEAENDAESIAMQHIINNADEMNSWLTWQVTEGTNIPFENNKSQ
jgi:hypothetical protein